MLAALGVGLGFGLQEIVSNFVCGIILLLERPIRIGDVVTVAGTTGKVDRINIRATTIVNSDNQSMIVPNREFITGNLVNWTLKDKILRVPIKVGVAYGTDPDRVVELLLADCRRGPRRDAQPGPSASLEGFGDSSLLFGLYTFVPEPGLAGDVQASPLRRNPAAVRRRANRDAVPDSRAPPGPRATRARSALTAPREEPSPGQAIRFDRPPRHHRRPTARPVHSRLMTLQDTG